MSMSVARKLTTAALRSPWLAFIDYCLDGPAPLSSKQAFMAYYLDDEMIDFMNKRLDMRKKPLAVAVTVQHATNGIDTVTPSHYLKPHDVERRWVPV